MSKTRLLEEPGSTKMLETGWHAVHCWSTGLKGHVCPTELLRPLCDELVRRSVLEGGKVEKIEETDVCRLDLPGMILASRSWEKFDVDGLTAMFPSADINTFRRFLEEAEERTFPDGTPYHKVHGMMWCLVLTPAQRDGLARQMDAVMPEALLRGAADDQRLQDARSDCEREGFFYSGKKKERPDA